MSANLRRGSRVRHFLQQKEPFLDPLPVLVEIVFAIPGTAVYGDAGTARAEGDQLYGYDVGETKNRRMLDVYVAPGSEIGVCAYDAGFT